MGRNKDIKLLHDFTGAPYSECRRKMKENHWELYKAMGLETVLDKLKLNIAFDKCCKSASEALIISAAEAFSKDISKLIDCVMDAIASVDWEQLAKALKETNDEQRRSDSILEPLSVRNRN